MIRLSRRQALLAGAAAVAGGLAHRAAAQAEPRLIEIVARRFRYEPAEVLLRVGERVVIAVKSIDFMHGMNIPDLDQRFDLMPGRITRFELRPTAAGAIDFVCDNFCGDGHEAMHGRFVVS